MKTERQRLSFGLRLGLSRARAATLARLRTPGEIQDFITAIPANFEPEGDTCMSVAEVLRHRRAHCIEAAFVAACALWISGKPPLLMDFQARGDYDHVVTLFRERGCWGAISKSNHVWMRWRDPVYRSLRELAMSYFHEYSTGPGKTMRTYSVPFDLRRFAPRMWITGSTPCWDVAAALDNIRHYQVVTAIQARRLRPLDRLEAHADKLLDYRPSRKTRRRRRKGG